VDAGFPKQNATDIESNRALFADERCELMVNVNEKCSRWTIKVEMDHALIFLALTRNRHPPRWKTP
jgi:hypothetical protein